MSDLELSNVTKKFGTFTAVDDFSIQVEKGEFISFLGPSGCGKTTTLRIIAGFIEPTAGEVVIQGRKVNGVPPYHRDTGMVFQNYALFPHMTVFENIAFGLRYHKVPKDQVRPRVMEMLKMVQLPGVENRRPAQLSGGQQQRIALARALVIKPKVLLFDEPLSNLDAKLREALRVELRQIQKEVGITSIFVTHDQEEALALSDRIVVMNNGRITQIGTPFEVYEKPSSVFVGEFLGQPNFLTGQIESVEPERVVIALGGGIQIGSPVSPGLTAGQGVRVLIRAERVNLRLAADCPHLANETNVLPGIIHERSYLGGNTYYYVRLENGEQILAIEQTAEKEPLHRKAKIYLHVGFKSCLLFPVSD